MALNWYLQLRNLAKSDPQAAELFEHLQKAETDEQKETAKQNAQAYIAQKESKNNIAEPEETKEAVVEASVDSDPGLPDSTPVGDTVHNDEPVVQESAERSVENEEKIKSDLSQPAFNPRLAKCGITREEELFLNGVFVRKMSREEKLLMRRSIYQKKTQRNAAIQAEYRAKRLAQKEKDLNDPEKIKFHQERKLLSAVVDALVNHKNFVYIFSEIEGLTPEIMKELLQKPGNRNAVNQANRNFLENFKTMYGE